MADVFRQALLGLGQGHLTVEADDRLRLAQIGTNADAVIEELRTKPVSAEELARARTKMRSSLYSTIDGTGRIGLIDLLATFKRELAVAMALTGARSISEVHRGLIE